MLQARTVEALGFRDRLAQLPQRRAVALAARQHGIQDEPFPESARERLLQQALERILGTRARELAQHVPCARPLERIAHTRDVLGCELHGDARDELEGAETG